MKCISLIQPWATLLISGHKRIETRHWRTPFRGRILIHASKALSNLLQDICLSEPFFTHLARLGYNCFDDLPRGALLGAVTLDHCLPVHKVLDLSVTERSFGDYTPGRFAWLTTDPVPLPRPYPHKGKLGLFDVLDSVWQAANT